MTDGFKKFGINIFREFVCGLIGVLFILLINQFLLSFEIGSGTFFNLVVLLSYIAVFVATFRIKAYWKNRSFVSDLFDEPSAADQLKRQKRLLKELKE